MTDKYRDELIATANKIATSGKGILAADESVGTIDGRFKRIQVENNEENRRFYREILFTAEGIEKYLSGVIFFEESLHHKTSSGESFISLLQKKGILIGVKVDKGPRVLRGTQNETFTQGFDDLDRRCKEFYALGARFAKWRAVLRVLPGEGQANYPSSVALDENARGLARYAAICQDNGLVPIVEPEVLVLEGKHGLETSVRVTQRVLSAVYRALDDANVLLEGTILKVNMVLPGTEGAKATPADCAHATLTVLKRTVPAAVPGINFLSGGMSEEEASVNLNLLNALEGHKRPWNLSFSYGRALQHSCLKVWGGKKENLEAAQKVLLERCKANSEASQGKYAGGAGGEGASASLFVSNYVY